MIPRINFDGLDSSTTWSFLRSNYSKISQVFDQQSKEVQQQAEDTIRTIFDCSYHGFMRFCEELRVPYVHSSDEFLECFKTYVFLMDFKDFWSHFRSFIMDLELEMDDDDQ